MGLFARKKTQLTVLIATRSAEALAALDKFTVPLVRCEAFSTGGAYKGLAGCHLVIADADDLVASEDITPAMLRETLANLTVPVATGAEVAADPAGWEARATAAAGAVEKLPPKAVAFANVSGGVGKTTCALDLAAFVAAEFGVPALVVEIGFGASALRAITNLELPHFYETLTQDVQPGQWRKVTLLPMDYRTARLALGQPKETQTLFERLKRDHVLTVVDANPAHSFWPLILPLVDEVYTLTNARPDALANALQLSAELNGNGHKGHAAVIVNQVKNLAEQAVLAGVQRALDLPVIEHPDRYDGRLARRLMPVIYPGWRNRRRKWRLAASR